jgi:O-antigen biosynthesis protein
MHPQVRGKFIFFGESKIYLRGVTYGPFRPDKTGNEYGNQDVVERDFARIAASGLNVIRTYTVPPRGLLDTAHRHGLRVMVGLAWEQHITFLDNKNIGQSIEMRIRMGVRACISHPAILCYAIGNEIPSSIVRWYGRRPVERFLKQLYRVVKAEDPEALVTYVNYPSTEYLQLPFIDFVCFNVYLEERKQFEAYLARLQNIAGDRPLVIAEIGVDSCSFGEDVQALMLDWQIRGVFAAGCAGACVFAWTDEWHRGGHDVEDWAFGVVDRARQPKPAFEAIQAAFADAPFPSDLPWPRISVVICSYNGECTIGDCIKGVLGLEYSNFEIIVVNDGSTDATEAIAKEYPLCLISTENRGLSNARNLGLEAATGEIVAYIDDDARPDPHWLTYLAVTFMQTPHVGVGGPNIAPPDDGLVAACVANAPGNPAHVLLSDQEAEHIPGCNMAFRTANLKEIGGFDPRYRVAGDDVDICWRLRERGWTLGFNPGAVVWHHRRNSVLTYWQQQQGYGRAEALLEQRWPERYNGAGSLAWVGRIYSRESTQTFAWRREQIHHGVWGTAMFQSVYHPVADALGSLLLVPEWYLITFTLSGLSLLGIAAWPSLLFALPILVVVASAPLIQAGFSAKRAIFSNTPSPSHATKLTMYTLTAFLYLLQPLARLRGRLQYGLAPWRRQDRAYLALPRQRAATIWSERWQAHEEWLRSLEATLRVTGSVVLRGGEFDRWDLEVRGGLLGAARVLMATEEHGTGWQLLRFRLWPRCSTGGLVLVTLFAALTIEAMSDRARTHAVIMGIITALLALLLLYQCAVAMAATLQAIAATRQGNVHQPSRRTGVADTSIRLSLLERSAGAGSGVLQGDEIETKDTV